MKRNRLPKLRKPRRDPSLLERITSASKYTMLRRVFDFRMKEQLAYPLGATLQTAQV